MLSLFKKDRDFFDSLFDEFRVAPFGNDVSMRTDIKENEHGYELAIEMPGFDKQDKVILEEGHLMVEAERKMKPITMILKATSVVNDTMVSWDEPMFMMFKWMKSRDPLIRVYWRFKSLEEFKKIETRNIWTRIMKIGAHNAAQFLVAQYYVLLFNHL